MIRPKTMLFAIALAGSAAAFSGPAVAYDPCQRAQEDVEQAEAAVRRWYARNCPDVGTCSGSTAYLLELGQRVQEARARRSRACA